MTARSVKEEAPLIGSAEVERVIARLAHQIVEPQDAQRGLFIMGVRRGGEALAVRLAEKIKATSGTQPQLGFLNINLYRDDDVSHEMPDSLIPADVNGKTVVIVDDVLYTGRTVRSALDAVTDLGRPGAIRLCVLIDRGLRELPVQADYAGRTIATTPEQRVVVKVGRVPSEADEVRILAGAS
ncbi:MAG: bifunctional pyr operon transcriptional regulator/uracil phosphoribosyltransferase PyrR [Candidatus Eremiobacteraeota bacterium]|nr:bifunctional pyr operon transcriptional regulator/uracil phosphoribosyltransferase PyrR [Candidatus Eremiobacteraeota bacterium]